MDFAAIPAIIDQKVNDYFLGTAFSSISKSNRSSVIGHECIRFLTYERRPEAKQKELPSVGLLKIFNEGNIQERAVIDTFNKAGLTFKKSQSEYFDDQFQISAHIDGFLEIDKEDVLTEIKSISPISFNEIKTIDDMKKARQKWFKHYIGQINIYMWLTNQEHAIFVFKNKTSGELRIIPIDFDKHVVSELCDKAEQINYHLKAGTLPNQIDNWDTCSECNYRHICLDKVDFGGASPEIWDRDEIIKDLDRLEYLKSFKKEYEDIEDRIKKTFNGKTNILAGNWAITGKTITRKASYIPESTYWKMSKKKIEVK